MARAPRSPFDIPLTEEQRTTLAVWLNTEISNGIAARSAQEAEVEYWHTLYEQGRSRSSKSLPWPDAADLTSYIPCEKVDAIQARIMRTVWVNPIWAVEGWGHAAERAPFVEEFHQWKAEEERLQNVLDKVSLLALIEPRALLEVSEGSEKRTVRKTIHAKPHMTPEGGFIFDEKGQPTLQTDAQGHYVEASGDEPAVQMVVDSSEAVRTGPRYRVLPYRDSLMLPGHARDKEEIWGYGKRIWRRHSDLVRLSHGRDAIYDETAVQALTAVGDREGDPALARSSMGVAPEANQTTAEKELWELLVNIDLNALFESLNREGLPGKTYDGARWYLVTYHLGQQQILRFQHDDFERSRYVPFILFPRPDRATEGFSFIGHKLLTTTEEHTAYRNMAADRSSMAVNAPIMKMQGALWDEDEQPMGPKAVITVRTPNEITPLVVPDVPASIFQQIERCERTGDRLAGVNDIASGQVAQESRTLGEIQMATEQSFVRMDLVVRRFNESMEDLGQIRHAIWKRVLAEQPEGIDAPESVIIGLEGRGVPIDRFMPNGKLTAAILDGPFRFKPYGSVETADPGRQRADWMWAMQALGVMLKAFPALGPMLSTPQAARAMFRQFLRVGRVPNPQAFLGSPSQDFAQQTALDQMPMPAMAPPLGMGMPGMPGPMTAGPMPGGPPAMGGESPPLPPQLMALLMGQGGQPPQVQ